MMMLNTRKYFMFLRRSGPVAWFHRPQVMSDVALRAGSSCRVGRRPHSYSAAEIGDFALR